jgi:hypothetical protein
MSINEDERKMRMAHRILILAYFFKRYLAQDVPNYIIYHYCENLLSYTEYVDVRNNLAEGDYIITGLKDLTQEDKKKGLRETVVQEEKRGRAFIISINPKGEAYVEGLLAKGFKDVSVQPDKKIPLYAGVTVQSSQLPQPIFINFLRSLGIASLLPVRLSAENLEGLFKALVVLYADSFVAKNGRPAVVEELACDYEVGLEERIDNRLAENLWILSYDPRDLEKVRHTVSDIIKVLTVVKRMTVLAYIWKFYGYNRVALHTVVRFAAFVIAGKLGKILSHITAAILVFYVFLQALALNLIRPEVVNTAYILSEYSFIILSGLLFSIAAPRFYLKLFRGGWKRKWRNKKIMF